MNRANTEGKSASKAAVSVTNTSLTISWLLIARVVWLLLVIPSMVLFVASLFVSYQQIQTGAISSFNQHQLAAIGISLSEFASLNAIFNVITSLIWYGVGFLIFWRKSDDWLALLAAFVLVMFNVGSYSNNTLVALSSAYPALLLPLSLFTFLADCSLGAFLLLFPGGSLVPRWMWLFLLLYIIQGILSDFPSSSSSFAAHWPGWLILLITLVIYGGIIYSQVYRFRYVSTPLQRQQTKWVILGVTVAIVGIIVILGITYLITSNGTSPLVGFTVTFIVWPVALLLIPLSIGFSILRYRLYDIDLLINRTLVYGTLTVLLALIYFGCIIGLQALLSGIDHADNSVAIVASTLLIAALFRPLRHRLQAIIDRRFYRRKYDAARTIAEFSATLSNEVDLAQLSEHLVSVVDETMQPKYISLWLRPQRK